MMLPQQLEGALLGDEGGEEAAQLVSDWIDKASLPLGWPSLRLCGLRPESAAHIHTTGQLPGIRTKPS